MGTRHGLALCWRSRALRGRFFDFQDIGPRGDLEQVIKELKVFRPFPGPSGEFHKRRLLAIADNGRHPKDVVRLARLFVIGPTSFLACAQILRQYGGVYIDFPGYSQQLQRIGDIAFVHVIGAKDGHVVALERRRPCAARTLFTASCGGMSRLVKRASSQAFHPSSRRLFTCSSKKAFQVMWRLSPNFSWTRPSHSAARQA